MYIILVYTTTHKAIPGRIVSKKLNFIGNYRAHGKPKTKRIEDHQECLQISCCKDPLSGRSRTFYQEQLDYYNLYRLDYQNEIQCLALFYTASENAYSNTLQDNIKNLRKIQNGRKREWLRNEDISMRKKEPETRTSPKVQMVPLLSKLVRETNISR